VSVAITAQRGRIAAALAVAWFVWGSTYVAIRIGVRGLPPLTMSGARFLLAGLLIYGWCWWQRRRRPEAPWQPAGWREWRASAILGLALPAAGTGGATWSEQKLPAGTAALLLATIPVWLVIASHAVGAERVTRRAAAGLLLGLGGVAVLVSPFSGGAPNLAAAAVALGGALCWGCGSVYAKRAPHPDQPLLGSGMQLICAGAALCAAGALSGEPARVHPGSLTSASMLALGYLILFGSLAAYCSYEWLIRHASGRLAGTYAFVNPVVAVLLGWWLLAERVSGRMFLAVAVIVTGVALIVLPSRQNRAASRETGRAPGRATGRAPAAGRCPEPAPRRPVSQH
jgi:drug/metabolite transporter (DMT)-like permease